MSLWYCKEYEDSFRPPQKDMELCLLQAMLGLSNCDFKRRLFPHLSRDGRYPVHKGHSSNSGILLPHRGDTEENCTRDRKKNLTKLKSTGFSTAS